MTKTIMNGKKEINITGFFALIDHISGTKNVPINEVIKTMEEAIIWAFHKNFDQDADLTIKVDPENKTFTVTNNTTMVVENSLKVDESSKMFEIRLEDALKINPNIKVDDTISTNVDFSIFKNEIVGQIENHFRQELTKKYKEVIYNKYKDLKGEIIKAEVISVLPQQVLFKIEGKAEGFMPNYKRNNRQKLSPGQIVEVYVEDVSETGRGSQIEVSNGSIEIVKKYLEIEIPEIEDGSIEVVAVSRIPGFKSKVAIKSNDPNIDPVGAVIGSKGSRINSVSDHLFGERIDVIRWSGNIDEFVANSISPAKTIAVVDKNPDETIGGKIMIVPNRHQTLAIGKGGTNIKLASHLTGQKLDVISLEQANEREMKFEWNGNVSPNEVEQIEKGHKLQFTKAPKNKSNLISLLDNDISSFREDIAEFDSSVELSNNFDYEGNKKSNNRNNNKSNSRYENKKHEKPTETQPEFVSDDSQDFGDMNFDYDHSNNFSDEELKKMEDEFGFGDFDLNEFKEDK